MIYLIFSRVIPKMSVKILLKKQNVRLEAYEEPIVSYIIETFFKVLTGLMPSIVSKCRRYIYTENVIHFALREFNITESNLSHYLINKILPP